MIYYQSYSSKHISDTEEGKGSTGFGGVYLGDLDVMYVFLWKVGECIIVNAGVGWVCTVDPMSGQFRVISISIYRLNLLTPIFPLASLLLVAT